MSYQVYSNDGSKTGSPKKPPFLRYEDLTSRVEPNFTPRRSSAGGEDFSDNLRQKLSSLREENTGLVTQSQQLLGELEDTSHRLLLANREIENLKSKFTNDQSTHNTPTHERTQPYTGEPNTTAQGSYAKRLNVTAPLLGNNDRVGVAGPAHFQPISGSWKSSKEAEIDVLKAKLKQSLSLNEELRQMCTSHDRERQQWRRSEKSMKGQLQDTQEECKRLVDTLSSVEERGALVNSTQNTQMFDTTWTPQDTPGRQPSFTSGRVQTAPSYRSLGFTPSASRGNYHRPSSDRDAGRGDPRWGSRSLSRFPSDGNVVNYYEGSKSLPVRMGVAGGRGSLDKVPGLSDLSGKLSESLAESHYLRGRLEAAESKLTQCEREVSFLESELKQKSQQSQQHIEDLVSLQNHLTSLKEQNMQEVEEVKKSALEEVSMGKKLLNERISELEVQLSSGNIQLEYKEQEVSRLRGELDSLQTSLDTTNRKLSEATKELTHEREGHNRAVHKLSSEVDQGSSHVQKLEKALEQCQGELQEHLLRVQEDTVQRERLAQLHQKETADLTQHLKHSRTEVQQQQSLIKRLQQELEGVKGDLSRIKGTEDRLSGEVSAYKELLKHRDQEKEKLQMDSKRLERDLKNAQDSLKRKDSDAQDQAKKADDRFGELTIQLKQVNIRNQELERGKAQMDMVRETLEKRVSALSADLEKLQVKMDSSRSKEMELVTQRNEAEGRVREKEAQVEGTITQLKQDLVQRSQQIQDLDALLRNHQAETASRRLKLERSLAQRQSDLRARTQEVEELTERLRETEKALEASKVQLREMSSDAVSKMEDKVEVITKLQNALKALQTECAQHRTDTVRYKEQAEEMKKIVSSLEADKENLTEQWKKDKESHEKSLATVAKELEHCKTQYSTQIQQLQDSHAQVLASFDQQSASHRLHIQRIQDQEKKRSEELARCRAQSSALSSELAAEKKLTEDYQQQLTLVKAEAARYQAQASSYQRALTMNSYRSQLNPSVSQTVPATSPSTKSYTATSPSTKSYTAISPSTQHYNSTITSTWTPTSFDTTTKPYTSPSTSDVTASSKPVPVSTPPPLLLSTSHTASNGGAQVKVLGAGLPKPQPAPASPGRDSVTSDLAEFYPLPSNLSGSLLTTPPKQTYLTPASTQILTEHKEKSPKRGTIIDV